jgi:photosystem I P700 chlorophyll a apoprotein A1
MVRDYNPKHAYNNVLDRVLRHRDAIISHLNWVCIFLGTHSFGLYVHNDAMEALGRTRDMFSDSGLKLEPVFANWLRKISIDGAAEYTRNASNYSPENLEKKTFFVFGGDTISLNGKVAISQIPLGTGDFLVHHIHAFTIHVTVLILLKGVLFARNSRLVPDKWEEAFRFPCDGPGRGGTCQVSAWDHVFLGLFWMYNCISVTIFHFSWKMQSSVWGTVSESGISNLVTNFSTESVTVNGWLYGFLWTQSVQVITSYGTPAAAYGLVFLGAHFTWAFSLMFLFSGRGYWQELIESIVWAHSKIGLNPVIEPRALSITSGRAVGLAHFLLGGIGVTWAFFLGRLTTLS